MGTDEGGRIIAMQNSRGVLVCAGAVQRLGAAAFLLFLCVAALPGYAQERSEIKGLTEQGTVTIHGRQYVHLKTIPFQDASVFILHGVAADYIQQEYETFRSGVDSKTLYADGVIDAASFIIGEERFENIFGGSLLIFDKRHQQTVVGDIRVGDALTRIRDAYGRPDFELKGSNLIGYKTEHCYVAFRGATNVERIYVARRNAQNNKEGILPAYLSSGDDKWNFPFEAWGLRGKHLWRGSMTYYHADGLRIWVDPDPECAPVYVFNDYAGLVPKQLTDKDTIFFVAYDYPEHKIYLAVYKEEALQKQFETEGYYSPDRRIAAVTFGNCTYERAGVLFRFLDGSGPDLFIAPGHFPDKPVWLNRRYVGIETMHGFGIYDLQAHPATGESAVFYIEYHDAAGPFIKYFDQESGTLVIDTDGFTIRKKDGDEEIIVHEDAYLLLHLHYDTQENISVTTGRMRKEGHP